jgi:hypothetical protein
MIRHDIAADLESAANRPRFPGDLQVMGQILVVRATALI